MKTAFHCTLNIKEVLTRRLLAFRKLLPKPYNLCHIFPPIHKPISNFSIFNPPGCTKNKGNVFDPVSETKSSILAGESCSKVNAP